MYGAAERAELCPITARLQSSGTPARSMAVYPPFRNECDDSMGNRPTENPTSWRALRRALFQASRVSGRGVHLSCTVAQRSGAVPASGRVKSIRKAPHDVRHVETGVRLGGQRHPLAAAEWVVFLLGEIERVASRPLAADLRAAE